ncbi:MAG: hypothetical protein GY853_09370 [PVC group bacterium]|nr:hypothetical protein [PVC group bacterium]
MEPIKKTITIKILLIQDDDLWSAQCLNYDIAAQGRTKEEAQDTFEKTFLGQIILDIKENKDPLEGIGKAPQKFWDMFRGAEQPEDPRRFCAPDWSLPGFIINAQANDLRIASTL